MEDDLCTQDPVHTITIVPPTEDHLDEDEDSCETGEIFDDKEAGVSIMNAVVSDDILHEADPVDIEIKPQDTMRWFRMGTDRATSPNQSASNPSSELTLNQKYEAFIHHLRHVASYKAEFDIYQILAYRAKVTSGAKLYFKPFKTLKGLIHDDWSLLEIRWLNSYHRVLIQCLICWCIQTLGVTAILITQFGSYFEDASTSDRAQCDNSAERWRADWPLKLLAFLWTAFISLGLSGWVYRARHSGFYPILLFLKRDQYPNFVSIPILQIGLLTNYYVVTSSVIGSFVLIYQTEGGTQTVGMILQAVALFFVLELDNKMVHGRDFLSIEKYMDIYIRNGKHKKIPHGEIHESADNILQQPLGRCNGNSFLSAMLSMFTFFLLVVMTIGAFIAPWLIMICW